MAATALLGRRTSAIVAGYQDAPRGSATCFALSVCFGDSIKGNGGGKAASKPARTFRECPESTQSGCSKESYPATGTGAWSNGVE